jgi:beta-phosphoglucomutase-like phosphatase (HAD superfamily)
VLFDFNGTLSDDERIMCGLFQELFAERGRPLTEEQYFGELAGYSDPEVVRVWLGEDDPELVGKKIARYRERVADGSTVDAAHAAGIRCVAVLGTLPRGRLARADAIVERLDAEAVREALA